MITIPYDDYKELLEYKEKFNFIKQDILFIINNSELDYKKEKLNILCRDIEEIIDKNFSNECKKRIQELKEESEE